MEEAAVLMVTSASVGPLAPLIYQELSRDEAQFE